MSTPDPVTPANTDARVPKSVWLFLALALGISWSAYLIRQFADAPLAHVLRLVVKFGPSIAGLLVASWLSRAEGVVSILKRLVPTLRDIRWIIFALVMPLGVMAVATFLRVALATESQQFSGHTPSVAIMGFGSLLATRFFAGGGLGEELGWRGLMQPQLMQRLSPLRTSLYIGASHAVWHFPAFGVGVVMLLGFTTAMAVTATWIYQRSDGDLLPIALLHASGNASIVWIEQLFPALDNDLPLVLITFLLWVGFALLLIATGQIKATADSDSRS